MSDLREQYGFLKKISVWFDRKSVIVLTMGKVGTLTICNSLAKISKKHVHPHSLRQTRPGVHFLKNVELGFFRDIYYQYKTVTKRIKVFVWLQFAKEVTIITGVRDPFSRAVSAFVEQSHYLNINTKDIAYEEVYKSFKKHYDLEGGLHWFDNEINKVFGIDVYASTFDKNNGFQVIQNHKYKIFIYRIDYLNTLEDELKNFIEDTNFTICNANETESNENYQKLKHEVKFTDREFEIISNSKFMRHFYTDLEISSLKEKWIK